MKEKGAQFDAKLHDHCVKAGFTFRNGRYYSAGEPTWEKEKRIEKGRKQFAVPASSVEQFLKDEEKMVDSLLTRLREKAGVPLKAPDDDGEGAEEVEAPKEKKKKKREAAEEAEEAEEVEPKKEKKKKRKTEEAEDEG
mmetsp:Transcript_108832/g.314269  ORF Transcript_108832/g.314269 Transcript_108832/m.314269 type:complete len:138 (+) Transcript_108832:73-486(+)